MNNGTLRIRCILIGTVFLLHLLMPCSVRAWGRTGHRVAARMAEVRLTPAARAAVRVLLGSGRSFADASTWADAQQEIPDSGRWHYVNVPIREARYERRYCPNGACVVGKIQEFSDTLRNPAAGRSQKQRALKFLIHLIADIHQPLHVGDNGDRGGNQLQIRFFNEGSNLHQVWDSEVITRHTRNEQVWLWDFDFIANPRRVAEWSGGTPEDWATESLQIAREAYRLPGAKNVMSRGARLGNDYYKFALPIIQKQLAKSGVRIAFVLNSIYR